MMKRTINIATLVLLVAATILAQDSTTAKVDAYINSEMQKQQIPGVAVGVMRKGRLILAKGYGFANLEHQVPVTPLTIFQSGSMGKQFTATPIMMLAEEGKLRLDDSIAKYLPGAPTTWEKITVRHLLTHTGGIGDPFESPRAHGFEPKRESDWFPLFADQPLASKPGAKHEYSNGGYVALAAIIVVFYGVYGYFVESIVRIGFSVYQVIAVLAAIVIVMAIDIPMFRGARSTGSIRWGTIAPRSQYVLILLAVTFTWLMGLMGFARSGIRQHWHIWQVMQDTSAHAATPALGYAAIMISTCVLIFLALVAFIFWLGGLAEKSTFVPQAAPPAKLEARYVGD